jgi:serine phosphatase RsbU (regulator of sigma subunit)/pSer/pThr/pTyr-binding forkhead associated (FHA) protein
MAPTLLVIKGDKQGQRIDLAKDKLVIGRNPECDLVISASAVSREHAQILCINSQFFVKDLKSRNKTYVNNQEVNPEILVRLHDGDRVKICDFLCMFNEGPEEASGPKNDKVVEEEGSSTVMSTVEAGTSSHLILEAAPAERLKILLDITNALSKTLELEPLLPQVMDQLFQIFKQADRGFVVIRDESTKKLIPKAIKTRREKDETTARFSTKIVNQCIDKAQAILSEDALSDDRFSLSQSISDFRIRSVMCAPLGVSDGKVFGVIQLDTQDRSKKFTNDDLKLLVAVSNQAALAMENARVHEELLRRERRDREMLFATSVQRGFLPASLPNVPGYDFFAHYKAASDVGGDFYSFVPLPGQQKLVVAIGDVAGKGVPAALLMARLSADVRSCVLSEPNPATSVTMLNSNLQQAGLMDRFVTYAQVVLDYTTHKLTVVNAGHLAPIIRRAHGAVEEVADGDHAGLPLGVLDEYQYQSVDVSLNPGDTVVMCTDGIYDAMNPDGKSFSRDRVLKLLKNTSSTPALLSKELLTAVEQYSAGHPQHDDITLVSFGRHR